MENKLEQLLNSLIEKGWCPIWKEYTWPHKPFISSYKDRVHWKQFYYNEWWDGEYGLEKVFSLRDIVSKESWLWQYVCENDLLNIKKEKKRITPEHLRVFNWEYQYRLIESALIDERELESFILNNIKVDEKD